MLGLYPSKYPFLCIQSFSPNRATMSFYSQIRRAHFPLTTQQRTGPGFSIQGLTKQGAPSGVEHVRLEANNPPNQWIEVSWITEQLWRQLFPNSAPKIGFFFWFSSLPFKALVVGSSLENTGQTSFSSLMASGIPGTQSR